MTLIERSINQSQACLAQATQLTLNDKKVSDYGIPLLRRDRTHVFENGHSFPLEQKKF